MHYARWRAHGDPLVAQVQFRGMSPGGRFWLRVDKDGPVPEHRPEIGPCWLWTGALWRGYGQFGLDGGSVRSHRFAYEHLVGPIPSGMTLDHLCHNDSGCDLGADCPHRRCVNPAHLEPVPNRENVRRGVGPTALNARKTHCPRGHELTGENIKWHRGHRQCRQCVREANRAYKKRKHEGRS